ncbi:MAG: hypothetical protein U9O94_09240 [Nanoarchaeota archaeon]|nr:hypothetical protein [Nanoarchaeota archaeon]
MDFIEGILKITNLILAVVAGIIGISLIRVSHKTKELKAWVVLIIALTFFGIQEILGALRAFKIFESPYLTHIVPTIILALLIVALVQQIIIHKGRK